MIGSLAEQLNNMKNSFDRNKEEASINELSIIIWVCSNNISKDEIYQKLLGAMMDKTLI